MCAVIIAYKNNRKKCEFFVVLRNGQALLGMPDTAAVNIINVSIDSIESEGTQRENCNTNMSDAKVSNIKQETHGLGRAVQTQMRVLKILTMSIGQTVILIQTHQQIISCHLQTLR